MAAEIIPQLCEELNKIQTDITEFTEKYKDNKDEKYFLEKDELIDRFRQNLQRLDTHTSDMPEHNVTMKEYRKKFREIKGRFNLEKTNRHSDATRKELMAGANTELVSVEKTGDPNNDLMNKGRALNADIMVRLDGIKGSLAETEKLGIAIVGKIHDQNKILDEDISKMQGISATLSGAAKVAKRIARKLGTDKCLWVVIGCIVIAIVIAILTSKGVGVLKF